MSVPPSSVAAPPSAAICGGAAAMVPQLAPHMFVDAALSVDGRLLAAVTDDGLVTLADVATGKQLAHVAGEGAAAARCTSWPTAATC